MLLRHLGWEKAVIYWLIIASLIFYAWWSISYLLLLLLSVIINYSFHKLLLKYHNRLLLTLAVSLNLITLGYFKYADFLIASINQLTQQQLPLLHVILPLAISFFTFQQISFLFDTFQNKITHCDFSKYCLFVVFFPQLIAGPIVLQQHTIGQFNLAKFKKSPLINLALGATLFSLGLFKKIVLADGMAPTANLVFDHALAGNSMPMEVAWLGVFAYSFQIYFDFSGYCDMALGLARMFNITLPINFNSPYQATNIVDFWRRWHITLSNFLRDYLYIPLGGSRSGKVRQYLSLSITMLLGGLWHGASWTFVFWGGLHGLYLILNHAWGGITKKYTSPLPNIVNKLLAHILTMLAVMIAWVFFRAESFSSAIIILKSMAGQSQLYEGQIWLELLTNNTMRWGQVILLVIIVCCLPNSIEITQKYRPVLKFNHLINKTNNWFGKLKNQFLWQPNAPWSAFVFILLSTSLYYLYSSNNITEFIYFNF